MTDVQKAFETEWEKQHYVCPQCGPDPRGAAAHAQAMHTFDGLLGGDSTRGKLSDLCETVMRCVEQIEAVDVNLMDDSEIIDACKKLRAAVLSASS